MTSSNLLKLKADLESLRVLTEQMFALAQTGQVREEDLRILSEKCLVVKEGVSAEDLKEFAPLVQSVMDNLGRLIPKLQLESTTLRNSLDGIKSRTTALKAYTTVEHSGRRES